MNPSLIEASATIIAAAAGITGYGAAYPRSQLFGPTICHTNSARKLALTFDDGPNPEITPQLLDLLDRYQAKATFFLIGRFVRECPALVKETVVRGHVIGNHTDTHPNLFRLSKGGIERELFPCSDSIAQAVGDLPKWFRPPFGLRNPWVIPEAEKLGCKTAMWTLIPGDWLDRPAEWLIRRMQPIANHAQRHSNSEKQIPRFARNDTQEPDSMTGGGSQNGARGTGDVLCLHDGGHRQLGADRTRTLAALEHWLPRWRDLGLEFVTIDQAVR